MDTPILHEAGGAGTDEVIPDSVRCLDAALNLRVRTAATAADLDAALHDKSAIKRLLADLPPADVAAAAASIVARLCATEQAA